MMRVRYTCPPVAYTNIGSASSSSTPRNLDGSGSTIYLDRHPAECPAGSVIQRWQVYRPTKKTLAVSYSCAPLQGAGWSCDARKSTAFAPDGAGAVGFLDRHNVECERLV